MTPDEAKKQLRWLCGEMLRRIAEDTGHWSTAWPIRIRELSIQAEDCARVLGLNAPIRLCTIKDFRGSYVVELSSPEQEESRPMLDEFARDQVVMTLRDTIAALDSGYLPKSEPEPTDESVDLGDLVTLLDIATICKVKKRTARSWYDAGELPEPVIRSGHGKPFRWRWSDVRDTLETLTNLPLPRDFPDRYRTR